MSTLPLPDAIYRFKGNDERMDAFVNGDDTTTWTTSDGAVVPSVQKFLKDTAADITDIRDVVVSFLQYAIVIESTAGTAFHKGEVATTVLNARVFSNGNEVTSEIPASRFRWRRVSAVNPPYPYDDATWNTVYQSGYRTISVNTSDLYGRATFFCEILS